MEKVDLSKIMSVSGSHGLYMFIAQSRTGVVGENLSDGRRVNLPASGKMTTLEDISVYADDGEVKLRKVFELMKKGLSGGAAPSAKDGDTAVKALFEKVLPGYDRERFYLSHMKKVALWYNELREHACLDFVDKDAEQMQESK